MPNDPASPGAEAMTEPSKEARAIAWSFGAGWGDYADLAREIDALIEQRVAAAVREERERAVEILHDEGWLGRSEQRIAHPELFDRPAPEGAAPTKDGDTTRRFTSSQEDTGSVTDEMNDQVIEYVTGHQSASAVAPGPTAGDVDMEKRIAQDAYIKRMIEEAYSNGQASVRAELRALADKLTEANNAKS